MSGIVGDNIAGASGVIKGTVAVEILSDDPAILPGDTWTSSNNVNTKRQHCAGFGIQGAAVVVGGDNPTGLQSTEEYDGSTWTTVNNYLSATWLLSSNGILSAGLAAGGQNPSYTTQCGEYDGTSWTAGGSLTGGAKGYMAQCGTLNAGLCCGGYDGNVLNHSEEYNGTSWTQGNNMTAAREGLGAAGIQTSAIAFGGNNAGLQRLTQNYNGTNWSNAEALNNGKARLMSAGISSAAMCIGGWDAVGLSQTEIWDGTVWGMTSHLLMARYYGGACGYTSNAVAFAGESSGSTGPAPTYSGPMNSTEEWQGGSGGSAGKVWYNTSEARLKLSSNAGIWVSGGNMVSTLNNRGNAGTTNAGLAFVGEPSSNLSEEYNGTTWSATSNMTASLTYATGCGTQGSALLAATVNTNTYEYNGVSWGSGGAMAAARGYSGAFGDVLAAVVVGNYSYVTSSEEYNGASWSAGGAYPIPIGYGRGIGTLSAGMYGTGYNDTNFPTDPFLNQMATYDGTAWTVVPYPFTRRYYCMTSARGTTSSATWAGGQASNGATALSVTEEYNGVTWATARNMLFGKTTGVYGGTQTDMFAGGGVTSNGTTINTTEEYTIGTTSFNAIVNLT